MKKFLALTLALCMVFALCACGGTAPAATPAPTEAPAEAAPADAPADAAPASSVAPADLTWVTGGEAGTYYALGTVLAQYVSTAVDGLNVTAVAGNGSKSNVEDIDAGDVELGFCQSDVMSYAYSGTNLFADSGAVNSFSVACATYMEQVQIVTVDPAIKTVADLKGKNVSVGAVGSGTYFNAVDALAAYDMTIDDINPVYQSFADSAESLKDNKIDAAFIVAGAPTTAVTDLATAKDVFLVGFDDEHVAKLIEMSPYYAVNNIAAGTYSTMKDDCQTVAIKAVVLVADSVAEDAVYGFVSTIFENLDELTAAHAKAGEMSVEEGASITDVPYHPGAAKYFAEKGIDVAVK